MNKDDNTDVLIKETVKTGLVCIEKRFRDPSANLLELAEATRVLAEVHFEY
jgi:hypothetical protein